MAIVVAASTHRDIIIKKSMPMYLDEQANEDLRALQERMPGKNASRIMREALRRYLLTLTEEDTNEKSMERCLQLQRRIQIGKWIRQVRSYNKLNQIEFADILGISRSYVSAIERGSRNVPLEVAKFIREHMPMPLEIMNPDLVAFYQEYIDTIDAK